MKRLTLILIIIMSALCSASDAMAITLRDSLINDLQSTADDSLRMRNAYIYAQNHLDRFWALDILDIGVETAIQQEHVKWELALRGSRVRWAHRHHDWTRMDKFLEEQREAAFRLEEYGNYFGQVAQSVIVMNGIGRYEKSRELIKQMKKDIELAGSDMMSQEKVFLYIIEADYHENRGEKKKSEDIYLAALADTTLVMSDAQRISFYVGLMDIFIARHRHKEALAYADSIMAIQSTYSEAKQNLPGSRATVMEVFLGRAKVYEHIGDIDKMRENILTAESYTGVMSHSEWAKIYSMWEHYYNVVGDHKRALEYVEKAAREYLEEGYSEKAIQMEIEKTVPLWAMGQKEEAVDLYKDLLRKMDLMHQDLISGQHDFLNEQTKILQQQQRSINLRTWASYVMIIITIILVLCAISMLIYGLIAYRTLHKNHQVTRRKLRQAYAADRAKEAFLRNITTLINDPLQYVVRDAKQLSVDKTLTPEQQQELVRHSKSHVAKLMVLVNNVLDLSRLEACMMKYNMQEDDLVALTEQCAIEFNEENAAGQQVVTIDKQVDSFVKQTDATRFKNMLKSLFSAPIDHPEMQPTSINVKLAADDNKLYITITGSCFSDDKTLSEAERMTNSINRFIMRDFNGQYDATPERIFITVVR